MVFADWIDREPGPENIRYPLLLTVGFGEHLPPERLAHMLAHHRAMHESKLAEYLDAATVPELAADPYQTATVDFGITYERAVLDWFHKLPARLTRNT